MLINLSNTPSLTWSQNQIKQAVNEFENIIDIEIPCIDAKLDDFEIKLIADPIIEKCVEYFNNADLNNAVFLDADPIFTFYIVKSVLERGFRCITSALIDSKDSAGKDIFVRFREYRLRY